MKLIRLDKKVKLLSDSIETMDKVKFSNVSYSNLIFLLNELKASFERISKFGGIIFSYDFEGLEVYACYDHIDRTFRYYRFNSVEI